MVELVWGVVVVFCLFLFFGVLLEVCCGVGVGGLFCVLLIRRSRSSISRDEKTSLCRSCVFLYVEK